MVRKTPQKFATQATDYLSQISLDIKEGDLKNNPALVKKFFAELKEQKAEYLGLRESLKATQDAMESLNRDFHVLDKEKCRAQISKQDKGWPIDNSGSISASTGWRHRCTRHRTVGTWNCNINSSIGDVSNMPSARYLN